jgi:hypothetical protein
MNRTVIIYSLSDPRTDALRYVGKTEVDLNERLRGHLKETADTHKARWIAQLKSVGIVPKIEPLETLENPSTGEWEEAERFWIECLRQYGLPLTNLDAGGFGGNKKSTETKLKIGNANRGRVFPLEIRKKFSIARLSMDSEQKKLISLKISAANRQRKASSETREKLSLAHKGKKRSLEAVIKTANANRGKKRSIEFCQKIRLINLGRKQSAETIAKRSASMKGRIITASVGKKISTSKMGHSTSNETRLKISERMKQLWAQGKFNNRPLSGFLKPKE